MIEVSVYDEQENLAMSRQFHDSNMTLGEALDKVNNYIIDEQLNVYRVSNYHKHFQDIRAGSFGACTTRARVC